MYATFASAGSKSAGCGDIGSSRSLLPEFFRTNSTSLSPFTSGAGISLPMDTSKGNFRPTPPPLPRVASHFLCRIGPVASTVNWPKPVAGVTRTRTKPKNNPRIRISGPLVAVRHGLPTARLIWTVIDCSAFGARLTGILSRVLVARFDSGGCLDIVDGGCSCAIEVVYECRLRCAVMASSIVPMLLLLLFCAPRYSVQ